MVFLQSTRQTIEMGKDQTELQLQVIGRIPVPTSLYSLLLDQRTLESRKHWSFTLVEPPREFRQWIMNEYRLLDRMIKTSRSKGSMRVSGHNDLHDTNYRTLLLGILET